MKVAYYEAYAGGNTVTGSVLVEDDAEPEDIERRIQNAVVESIQYTLEDC
ncbi:hypothetical protein [Hominifimenecus sp. rT4P-3]